MILWICFILNVNELVLLNNFDVIIINCMLKYIESESYLL